MFNYCDNGGGAGGSLKNTYLGNKPRKKCQHSKNQAVASRELGGKLGVLSQKRSFSSKRRKVSSVKGHRSHMEEIKCIIFSHIKVI